MNHITFTTGDFRPLLYPFLWIFDNVSAFFCGMSCSREFLRVCRWNTWSNIFSNPWHLQDVCFSYSDIFNICHHRGMRCWDLSYKKRKKQRQCHERLKVVQNIINLFLWCLSSGAIHLANANFFGMTNFWLIWTNVDWLMKRCWLNNFEKPPIFWDC